MTTTVPLAASTAETAASDQLPRRLGLWATTAVVVGTIIGSGIFRVPASVAAQVGSSTAIVLVWVLGGVISLCGALALAELAAALPQSGGVFVYLRQAYGPLIAFLFGWIQLFLAPASVAGISLVFAEYLSTVVPLSPTGVRAVAALVLLLVGAAGYRSVRGLGAFIGVAAVAKVAAIATLVLAAFLLGNGDAGSLGRGAPPADSARWGGVGLALVAALWAYNGIHDMICVAGEVKDPGRVLPRALVAGVATVVVVYLAANAAYLYVLPFDTLIARRTRETSQEQQNSDHIAPLYYYQPAAPRISWRHVGASAHFSTISTTRPVAASVSHVNRPSWVIRCRSFLMVFFICAHFSGERTRPRVPQSAPPPTALLP